MELNESKVWGLVSAIQNGRADAIKDAFQETISQRVLERIGEKRDELATSMFDESGKLTK